RRLVSILPEMTRREAIEVTRIHSVAGLCADGLITRRPFRAPHHTISAAGLVGGGAPPRPGEATLAHHGALFLDELSEFPRSRLAVGDLLRRCARAGLGGSPTSAGADGRWPRSLQRRARLPLATQVRAARCCRRARDRTRVRGGQPERAGARPGATGCADDRRP